MDLKRIVELVNEGQLIEVRFLSDRGREESTTGDHPCMDAQARGNVFAYFPVFGSCAHAVAVKRVEEEGDEMYLHGDIEGMAVRLRISPLWTPDQLDALAAWPQARDGEYVERELERVLS